MKTKAIAALCCFSSTIAMAAATQERWVAVAGGPKVVYSVELSSIKPRGEYIRAWVHVENSQTRPDGFIGYGLLTLYNCLDEEQAISQVTGYSEPMQVRPNTPETLTPEFFVAPPGSANDQMLKFVCAYSKGDAWALKEKTSTTPTSPTSLQ